MYRLSGLFHTRVKGRHPLHGIEDRRKRFASANEAVRGSLLAIIWLLVFLTASAVRAAVNDPVDDWAPVDITLVDAQIDVAILTINVNVRDPLQNFLDHGRAVIQIFLDSDQDSTTGDYRLGAVARTDFLIECTGDYFSCTLHQLPSAPSEEMESLPFSLITGAAVTLPNSTTMTLSLPTSIINGGSSVDMFAIAYLEGNNAILDHRILLGNGDRCPDAGVLDTATGAAAVRRPGAPVDVSLTVEPNNPQAAYEIGSLVFCVIIIYNTNNSLYSMVTNFQPEVLSTYGPF